MVNDSGTLELNFLPLKILVLKNKTEKAQKLINDALNVVFTFKGCDIRHA